MLSGIFSKQYHRIYVYSEERIMLHEHIFIKDEITKKTMRGLSYLIYLWFF